ncbi:hypothetical protein VTO73DRAFT_11182 [Trametes versicolor]
MSSTVYTPLDHSLAPPLLPFHDVVNVTSADDSAPTQDALARGLGNRTSPSNDNQWNENTREGGVLANLFDFKSPREEEERALLNSIEGADDESDEEAGSDEAESDSSTAMDHGYQALGVHIELDDAASGTEDFASVDADSSADSESDVDMSEDQERVNDDDDEFYVAGKPTLDDASSVSSDSDDDSSSDSHIGVVSMDHGIAYTPSTAGPSTFPPLRRSKRIAVAAPKRARDEDPEDAFSGTPQAKRVRLTAPPAPRRRTTRARSTPEPASRATRIPSKGKERREPSRPLKMAASRATRIPRWFLEKYCIVNGEATCGAADCEVVLRANKPAVARKHVRTHHHAKGELGAAGAAEVMCLWGDCENMIRRGKNGGELMRHYDEVHLGVRYVCPGKCLDRQKERRSFRRTDQITRHEKDNPCEYLRENPIPRGEKDPDAKPRTRTKSLKQ